MTALAETTGIDLPVTATTRGLYETAAADGWAERNFPLLAAWYARRILSTV